MDYQAYSTFGSDLHHLLDPECDHSISFVLLVGQMTLCEALPHVLFVRVVRVEICRRKFDWISSLCRVRKDERCRVAYTGQTSCYYFCHRIPTATSSPCRGMLAIKRKFGGTIWLSTQEYAEMTAKLFTFRMVDARQ